MIGAFLNAIGILAGALWGLAWRKPVAARAQDFFKWALAAFTVFYGLRLVCVSIHGTFGACLKEILLGIVAVVLGYWAGRLLRLQTWSNRAGHYAATLLAAAQRKPPGTPAAGFVAATILFCAAPLGVLGAVADGLGDYYYLLLVKGLMDALAMMEFVKLFRWPVALAALPVFFFFNSLALLARAAGPWLVTRGLADPVEVAAGLVACSVVLVILGLRRVELANYLPALVVAPVLAHWLG
jgi:uncharacterized membrane protein YqgA involved in biofilm formation